MKIGKYNKYKENYVGGTVTDNSTTSNVDSNRTLWGNTDTGNIDISNSIYVTGNLYAYVPDNAKDEENEEDTRNEYDPYEPESNPSTRTPPFEEEEEKYNGCFIADDGFIGKRGEFNDNSYSKTVFFDYPERTPDDSEGKTTYDNKKDLLEVLKMLLPVGSIMMHNGSITKDVLLSYGWAVCDGTNGTPDLTNKFIKGGTSAGTTGGNATITLTTANLPSHSHTYNISSSSTGSAGSHTHSVTSSSTTITQGEGTTASVVGGVGNTSSDGSHTHSISTSSTSTSSVGSGTAFNIEPPYYTLIYIMRIS